MKREDVHKMAQAQVHDCVRLKEGVAESRPFDRDIIARIRGRDGIVVEAHGDNGPRIVRFVDDDGRVETSPKVPWDREMPCMSSDLINYSLWVRLEAATREERQEVARIIFAPRTVALGDGFIQVDAWLWLAFARMEHEWVSNDWHASDVKPVRPSEALREFLRCYTEEYRRTHPPVEEQWIWRHDI